MILNIHLLSKQTKIEHCTPCFGYHETETLVHNRKVC